MNKMQIRRKFVSGIRFLLFRANYFAGNFKEVVWLLGDARSGTTWIAALINHNREYREMFEPFNHVNVKRMNSISPHLYLRPETDNLLLEEFASDVFSGRFSSTWSDFGNRSMLYRGLLVKDVWANLFSFWASSRFPEVKKIFLIRNPFAVALSKSKTMDWQWVKDPVHFLKQKDLLEDYLDPFEKIIRKTSMEGDYILCQIVNWCILNLIPLKQFRASDLHIVFYEKMYNDPQAEIKRVFEFLKRERKDRTVTLDQKLITKPSSFAGDMSNIKVGISPLKAWERELSTCQIDAGMKILDQFGFGGLYDTLEMPDPKVIDRIQTSGFLQTF